MSTEYRLPDEFPDRLSDEQVGEVIHAVAVAIRTRTDPDLSKWLPELKIAVLQAALLEQSRRQSDAAVQS
ncbi:MAG TPA: hypothetical protein VHI55_02375, partial [Gaiellaceae bacterium]|nr:hypothetical protein [Gaiellaceae bacterium]